MSIHHSLTDLFLKRFGLAKQPSTIDNVNNGAWVGGGGLKLRKCIQTYYGMFQQYRLNRPFTS